MESYFCEAARWKKSFELSGIELRRDDCHRLVDTISAKVDEYVRVRNGVLPVGAAQVERPNLGTGGHAQITKRSVCSLKAPAKQKMTLEALQSLFEKDSP